MAEPVIRNQSELEALGWEVHVLEGLDHTSAMQAANVVPILRPWLDRISTRNGDPRASLPRPNAVTTAPGVSEIRSLSRCLPR
jgi:hypothetical protein